MYYLLSSLTRGGSLGRLRGTQIWLCKCRDWTASRAKPPVRRLSQPHWKREPGGDRRRRRRRRSGEGVKGCNDHKETEADFPSPSAVTHEHFSSILTHTAASHSLQKRFTRSRRGWHLRAEKKKKNPANWHLKRKSSWGKSNLTWSQSYASTQNTRLDIQLKLKASWLVPKLCFLTFFCAESPVF